MDVNSNNLEHEINQEVERLAKLLSEKEEILSFQKAEKSIEANTWIQETIGKIKQKQKEIVNFEYYEKPQAYKQSLDELNRLNNAIDDNISVQKYRTALAEANEIVQLVFRQIQDGVDKITD